MHGFFFRLTPVRARRPWGAGPRSALAALCALLVAACGGDDKPPRLERPNIVLITIDTLRADHLGCYGYFRDTSPVIDALAEESLVFDQAYAVMATTLPSHASMLTSRYPLEHGITANAMHGGNPFGWKPDMLSFAQVAKDAGYATAGFVSAAPLKTSSGIHAGFDKWEEPEKVECKAEETIDHALEWLSAKPEGPYFLWVHLYDPHWKHTAPPPFDQMFHSDEPDPKLEAWLAERRIGDAATRGAAPEATRTREAINAYCGEIRYTDTQVGRLLERLRTSGDLERSVLMLTSDHGEGLNQHGWTAHGLVWDEQLRVPLLMRFPSAAGVAPRRVDTLMSLVDLLPTALARIEPFETPSYRRFLAQATGADVLTAEFRERPLLGQRTGRELPEDPGETYAVTTREWKFIEQEGAEDQLFDRRRDPHELENLAAREQPVVQRVRKIKDVMVRGHMARGAAAGDAAAGALDPQQIEDLKALGYLGGDDGRSQFEGDGKDKDESRTAPIEQGGGEKPREGARPVGGREER